MRSSGWRAGAIVCAIAGTAIGLCAVLRSVVRDDRDFDEDPEADGVFDEAPDRFVEEGF